jgi:hypothetical protein
MKIILILVLGLMQLSFSNDDWKDTMNQYRLWQENYAKAYPRGDIYYLIGNLSKQETDDEVQNFASVARWLANKNYRTILNANASINDVREAVSNPNTVAIIWSSHGNTLGQVFTSSGALPEDAFDLNASPSFERIILSNCHGDETVNYYPIPASTTYWEGTTTSSDLQSFLFSERFDDKVLAASEEAKDDLACNLNHMRFIDDLVQELKE